MENFMGQLILDDEIDYEVAKECLEEQIRSFVGEYVYNCCPKEYRQSDEWKKKDLLLKDLCARLPYFTKVQIKNEIVVLNSICDDDGYHFNFIGDDREGVNIEEIKPYLFPLSSITDEDYAIYLNIWEVTGKTAYLEGCHHLIRTIKAYKAANDYLLSKHYDINGLIPMGLANDATDKNIY